MRRAFLFVILSSIVVTVYLNSFPAQFHYDDFALMLDDPRVTSPDFQYLSFVEYYGGRPLSFWTFYLNYQLSGADASFFHAVNLLLHTLAACLLALLVYQFARRRDLSFLAAFIFAVHPVQTQAVNYIWSRSVLLMTVFALLSGLLIRRRPVWAVICLQLAIWSRAEALILILPLLVLRRRHWQPLVGVGVANCFLILLALKRHDADQFAWNHTSMFDFWKTQTIAAWKYLEMMIWPTSFSIDYQLRVPSLATSVLAGAGLLLVIGGLSGLLLRSKSARIPAGALLLSLLALTPSLLVPNTDLFNESRIYMAFSFFSIAIAWALLWLVERVPTGQELRGSGLRLQTIEHWSRRWAGVLAAIESNFGRDARAPGPKVVYWKRPLVLVAISSFVAILLIPTTLDRNRVWRSDIALWHEAAIQFPNKGRIRYNLGVALARAGQPRKALGEFQAAVSLMPDDDLSYAAIGYCAELAGDWRNARHSYQRALSLNPGNDYAAAGLRRVNPLPRGQDL